MLARPAVAVAQGLPGSSSTCFGSPFGVNDLGLLKSKVLVVQVKEHLEFLQREWLGVLVMWSAMVPHKCWQNALCPRAIEKAPKNPNHEIKHFLGGIGGCYLPHPLLWVQKDVLYRSDGVHLSEKGLDIFRRT